MVIIAHCQVGNYVILTAAVLHAPLAALSALVALRFTQQIILPAIK
ncbi:hypothetical protein GPUN_2787 [Glaciecola punicea ACAM 611]|uniref:Uncharacterized protein n=1 Tax=Glaciecola punicea ACAM 611 TaxID=1121923 RepID=H5TEX4_9ALTE|nr:hypothetical protein GPUN_2787 [Glaciecola punicea ACAM 611]